MKTLISYAKSFLGKPYRWGGDDPMAGFDCSGLIQEILASVGADPKGDQTADGLYRHFLAQPDSEKSKLEPGSLLFFGSQSRITHIAMAIDKKRMIEAGGGGSKTTSEKAAIDQNAYIRIRPIKNRSDLVDIILPYYPDITEA